MHLRDFFIVSHPMKAIDPSEYGGSSLNIKKVLSLMTAVMLILSLFTVFALGAENADNYEEGVNEADNIVHTTAAEKVILVVSFGTSYNQSRALSIGGIESAMRNAYPAYQIRRAFTSQIIIDKLAERDGLQIDNVEDAMNRLVLDKVKEVVVQPTHVMQGFEYDDMVAEIMPFADKFESLKIGKPLLTDDNDYDEVAELIVQETEQCRADDTAIVFMGHGTEHEAGIAYTKLQDILAQKGYTDYVIGTVEHGTEIDDVREILSEMDVQKVVLRPLMVVAGDHANNDMAGDEEDSWKVILEQGYTVETILEGLGQIPGIQEIYIRHVEEAMDSDTIITASTANAVGAISSRIQNGEYSIEVETDSSMLRVVDCLLTVVDDGMTAAVTLSGTGYSELRMGEAEPSAYTLVGDRHVFTVPVAALDIELNCAARGVKSGNWFDHAIIFSSSTIPDEAFLPCQIDVQMKGGSGRASIESPATLLYEDGRDIARIVWSSPNYIYMLVDGAEYLPINSDGNSTFAIPVQFDVDMVVTACTVAMSEPKEIEYTLYFDSSTIR